MEPAITDNKHRVTIASYDLAGRENLERVGYWLERGTLQEYVMRQDRGVAAPADSVVAGRECKSDGQTIR